MISRSPSFDVLSIENIFVCVCYIKWFLCLTSIHFEWFRIGLVVAIFSIGFFQHFFMLKNWTRTHTRTSILLKKSEGLFYLTCFTCVIHAHFSLSVCVCAMYVFRQKTKWNCINLLLLHFNFWDLNNLLISLLCHVAHTALFFGTFFFHVAFSCRPFSLPLKNMEWN